MKGDELSLVEAAAALKQSYHTTRNWVLKERYGLQGGQRGRWFFVSAASVKRARRQVARRSGR